MMLSFDKTVSDRETVSDKEAGSDKEPGSIGSDKFSTLGELPNIRKIKEKVSSIYVNIIDLPVYLFIESYSEYFVLELIFVDVIF